MTFRFWLLVSDASSALYGPFDWLARVAVRCMAFCNARTRAANARARKALD